MLDAVASHQRLKERWQETCGEAARHLGATACLGATLFAGGLATNEAQTTKDGVIIAAASLLLSVGSYWSKTWLKSHAAYLEEKAEDLEYIAQEQLEANPDFQEIDETITFVLTHAGVSTEGLE